MENLKIATWDIKNEYLKLCRNRIKAACVIQLLKEQDLDFLALQEVNPILAKRIEESLKILDRGYNITSVYKKPGLNPISNLCVEQNIIISRLQPINPSYDTKLPRRIKLTNPNTMRRRHLVSQEFDFGTVSINNTHLDYIDDETSKRQMQEVLSYLEITTSFNIPTVLVGNLNKKPSEQNMIDFTKQLSDLGMKVVDNPNKTYVGHIDEQPVDYVIVPKDWEASVETLKEYGDISSHYPVVVKTIRI